MSATTSQDAGRNASAESLRLRGNEHFAKGEYVHALSLYSEALRLNPDIPELWSNRAACYMKAKQPHLAMADALTLVDIRPDWPKSYFRLGKACVAMGGYGDALEWYNAGLTCAEMLGLGSDVQSLRKCLRHVEKMQKKGPHLHEKLAKEMNFESELFYTPQYTAPRPKQAVKDDPQFFHNLTSPFPVKVVDIESQETNDQDDGGASAEIGGGRGLIVTKDVEKHSTVFLDEQILCVSYSPHLCDYCGAALPAARHAVQSTPKGKDSQRFETYCRCACLLSTLTPDPPHL